MGNRAYITFIDSDSKRKSYYTHWNGGPDTMAPLFNYVFQNNVTDFETVDSFFKEISGRNFELMDSIMSPYDLEENGHYLIDLNKKIFQHYYGVFNEDFDFDNGEPYYSAIRAERITDFEKFFEDYNKAIILLDHQDENRKVYWEGIPARLAEKFPALKIEAEIENTEKSLIDLWKEESRYRLAAKEKTFLKRKLKALSKELGPGLDLKASMRGDNVRVSIINSSLENIDLEESFRATEKYSYNGETVFPQMLKELRESIEEKIDAIILPHQECYSERDLYTDYYGSYRISYYYKETNYSDSLKAELQALYLNHKEEKS